MPRSSRHKSSHKSRRRGSPVEWSGSDEEREPELRVSRDSESEKRKSSHSKESNNGYAATDHGKKRKERIESKDESGASDRWDSGLGKDGDANALVEKRSKADVYNTVDIGKERDKEKYLKEESKSRSSRRHDERSEEKRQYKEEKERDKDREREKEKTREKEKDKEQEKEKDGDRDRDREREKDRDRDRDRERSSRREKYEEDKREKERYEGDKREVYEEDKREKERHLEDKGEKHRYEEVKIEKEKYDEDKRETVRRDDNVASRKRESETIRIEEGNSANKDVDIINETDPTNREQREKHSKRRRNEISPEERDKDREREKDREIDREREKEKEKHKDDHSKSRASKEYKSEPDKYKDKHRDRDREDRREREYYEYRSSREGNRSSESRYKKSKGSEADPYDIRDGYATKHKDGHGSKRGYEATEDRHEQDVEKEDVERFRGEYRYGDKEKEKGKEKEKERVDSSPGKIRPKNSPGSISHHDREQNRHRSKPAECPKKELIQEDRPRARTSSTGERTPSRLRDEKLNRLRDDGHSLELTSEIASSTPWSDTHASPKFAQSPSNTSLKYSSSRDGSGSSKYRDRNRDRERDSDVPAPDKLMTLKREPTPVGTFNRSNSSGSYPPLPYEDGDRRESGPDRRFHKRVGHAHGNNNWNGAPNWASQVNNGFMPLPSGPPPPSGFHHFGGPPPPLFGIRPPHFKLGPSGVGVPFPMNDPLDRFSGPMRGPYGWHNGGNNPLEDSFPPNLWGPAGNGVFGTEPFWDQNRSLPSWKAQGEVLNKELINVSQKEIGATPPAIKVEEQSINENLPSESVDIKVEIVKGGSSVETSIKDQELQKVAPEVDYRQAATVKVVNFWESCIPRAAISRNLVDLEMLNKFDAAVGELEELNGASDMSQADLMDRKKKRNGMSIIVLKSLFPISKDQNFQKAMSLYNKLSNRQKPEKNNGLLGAPDLKESEVHNQSEEINMQVDAPVTDNMSLMGVKPDMGKYDMEVDKKVSSNFVSDSDSVIFKAEECEQVMKESSEDGLSRIPITESTH